MKMLLSSTGAIALLLLPTSPHAQNEPVTLRAFVADTPQELRSVDADVRRMANAGELRMSDSDPDALLAGHTIDRFDQWHDGIQVFGGDVVRDSQGLLTHAIFGQVATTFSTSTPKLSPSDASERFAQLAGANGRVTRGPTLRFLPLDNLTRLAYSATVVDESGVWTLFLDAADGSELQRVSDIRSESAVGVGKGVLGDLKKVSISAEAGAFYADDHLRPPKLMTFDMRGNYDRMLLSYRFGFPLLPSDRASSATSDWSDSAAVDAHANIGWTYDYYYSRFGRRGLDNRNRPLYALIHYLTQQQALVAPASIAAEASNASWCDTCGPDGVGLMKFGDGIPSGYYNTATGQNVTYLAGALDVIAHELTHGVTSSTSDLVYLGESGALNESFSDMMGTSTEFFYQQPGSARGQADYLLGEDVFRAVLPGALNGIRSMSNPGLFGDPDHYSRRLIVPPSVDGGGVHTNSAIPNQAFYLAIEGGTNRTSGITVQGVGVANREQIEKVFYRAFTSLLPSSANFSLARAATIQSARDLYGSGGAVERAVTGAWTAVGVN